MINSIEDPETDPSLSERKTRTVYNPVFLGDSKNRWRLCSPDLSLPIKNGRPLNDIIAYLTQRERETGRSSRECHHHNHCSFLHLLQVEADPSARPEFRQMRVRRMARRGGALFVSLG
jgi:hypothetical protein